MNPRNILLKSKSWKEFEKLIKPLNKTDKGFCFALLVRYYLLIDPQYSTKIKNDHVWFATSNPLIPERIKKHIDYPEDIGDEGIDLFAETKEGIIDGTNEVWANMNEALQRGYRGLKAKTSLAKLFKKHKLK
jgi:hypothetical protein